MAHTPSHRAVLPKKRVRRTQERAEITRAKLIDAGKELFSKQGFDGV